MACKSAISSVSLMCVGPASRKWTDYAPNSLLTGLRLDLVALPLSLVNSMYSRVASSFSWLGEVGSSMILIRARAIRCVWFRAISLSI
jgi:hypothetical protein